MTLWHATNNKDHNGNKRKAVVSFLCNPWYWWAFHCILTCAYLYKYDYVFIFYMPRVKCCYDMYFLLPKKSTTTAEFDVSIAFT